MVKFFKSLPSSLTNFKLWYIESATSECMTVGGERFVTFMYYLSTVEAGGHTVFPQAGVSGNRNSEDQPIHEF